mmetsp:Transcript_32275/g.94397  ORF Transcript_32275/g.94397 Transcript_32275/m.94397 type:complete len:240 (-) Transcript_32275:119-838(-)
MMSKHVSNWAYGKGIGVSLTLRTCMSSNIPWPSSWKMRVTSGGAASMVPSRTAFTTSFCVHCINTSALSSDWSRNLKLSRSMPSLLIISWRHFTDSRDASAAQYIMLAKRTTCCWKFQTACALAGSALQKEKAVLVALNHFALTCRIPPTHDQYRENAWFTRKTKMDPNTKAWDAMATRASFESMRRRWISSSSVGSVGRPPAIWFKRKQSMKLRTAQEDARAKVRGITEPANTPGANA